jgi:hypothetical protein
MDRESSSIIPHASKTNSFGRTNFVARAEAPRVIANAIWRTEESREYRELNLSPVVEGRVAARTTRCSRQK